jgi:hypothetical protein
MTPARPANVAASVRGRLLNVAKAQGVDFNHGVESVPLCGQSHLWFQSGSFDD